MKLKLFMVFVLWLTVIACTEEVVKDVKKEDIVNRTDKCSYCPNKTIYLHGYWSSKKERVLICSDCIILTFDLMLGRKNK